MHLPQSCSTQFTFLSWMHVTYCIRLSEELWRESSAKWIPTCGSGVARWRWERVGLYRRHELQQVRVELCVRTRRHSCGAVRRGRRTLRLLAAATVAVVSFEIGALQDSIDGKLEWWRPLLNFHFCVSAPCEYVDAKEARLFAFRCSVTRIYGESRRPGTIGQGAEKLGACSHVGSAPQASLQKRVGLGCTLIVAMVTKAAINSRTSLVRRLELQPASLYIVTAAG